MAESSTKTAKASQKRMSMHVPESFHRLLSKESERLDVPMKTLLALYGDRMIAAIRD